MNKKEKKNEATKKKLPGENIEGSSTQQQNSAHCFVLFQYKFNSFRSYI